jgi:hypothetical protein
MTMAVYPTIDLPVCGGLRPERGFVTGGGWIDSPVNANYQYMQTGGKANFGFVAKYKKGECAGWQHPVPIQGG